jgi:hypothetical protein
MLIEAAGPQPILEQLRLHLEDQLARNDYSEGPKYSSMDRGILIDYVKGDVIVSIRLSAESDSGRAGQLSIESEVELPDLAQIWDDALIAMGRNVVDQLKDFAQDKSRVEREMGS